MMDAKCSICGAPAQRQFTEIVGGKRRSMPVCLECAERQEFAAPSPARPKPPKVKIKLQAQVLGPGIPSSTLRCPGCGIRLVELRKTGRVGCPQCYEVFRKQIVPLLKRVHGGTEHEGVRPPDRSGPTDLTRLREELRRAIEAEDFEQAARLRDRIGSTGRGTAEETGEDHE